MARTNHPAPAGDFQLLRVADVAAKLQLSRSKVYELISDGTLPSVRIAASVRVPEAELRLYIHAQLGK